MPATHLAPRNYYHELTAKQKAIIDAYADNPAESYGNIAEQASNALEDDTVSRSYVRAVLDEYRDLAEEQHEKELNKRRRGREETTGDPFARLEEPRRVQTFSERPAAKQRGASITVTLGRGDVKAVLEGEVTEEFKNMVVDELLNALE